MNIKQLLDAGYTILDARATGGVFYSRQSCFPLEMSEFHRKWQRWSK